MKKTIKMYAAIWKYRTNYWIILENLYIYKKNILISNINNSKNKLYGNNKVRKI